MSAEALTWLRTQMPRDGAGHPDPFAKLVLYALCERANAAAGNTCYPGQKLLVQDTGLALKTVRARIRSLESAGYIAVSQRRRTDYDRKGQRTSDMYRICVERPADDLSRNVPEPTALRDGRHSAPSSGETDGRRQRRHLTLL